MSDTDNNQVSNEVAPEAPAESKELSLAEELSQVNDKTSDEAPETPVEEAAEAEEVEQETPAEQKPENEVAEETPVETEAERKQRFYELRQQQKQAKRQIEDSISQAYQPQSTDELVAQFQEQGYSQFEAEMKAENERRNQADQIREARTQVAELNMRIETESVQVMHDYPVFDPQSPEYDADLAKRASAMYARAAQVQTDPKTGVIVAASLTPYEFYKEIAEMQGSRVAKAQVQAQKAVEQQMASVAPPSSTAPVVEKSAEDAEAERLRAAFAKTA